MAFKTECPLAYMYYIFNENRLLIGTKNGCRQQPMKVICLDQSISIASLAIQKKTDNFEVCPTQALVGMGGFFIVVEFMALAVAKYYIQTKMLKKELNTLKIKYGLKITDRN